MKKNSYLGLSPEGFHHIAYTEWGSWSPLLPSIICVHGLTRNSHDFDELANFLSNQGRYVLCPDVVGRGDSSWFTNPAYYNFTQYINDMNALLARSNTHHVDWIGTSMGGLIGMMLAALPNTPIRRLVLNDIGPQIPIAALRRIKQYADKNPEFPNLDTAKAYFKNNYASFGELTEKQWDHITEHSVRHKAPGLYTVKMDPKITKGPAFSQKLKMFFLHPTKALEGVLYDIDLWSIWKRIECPVLIIHGKKSDLLTNHVIKEMRRTHPYAEVYEIEDAGHAPALLNHEEHDYIYQWLIQS